VDQELAELTRELLEMASRAEAAISLSTRALLLRDPALAEHVLRNDDRLNQLEVLIDERCMRLLALYQPEAGDLRFVAMALKITNDLERIGDQAVNIAERSLELMHEPPLEPLLDLPELAQHVQRMLTGSVEAFVRRDAALAQSVCRQDDTIDGLDDQIFRQLLTYMLQDYRTITRAVHMILISRHLERVADHATNIAEGVIYLVEGRQIKHHITEIHGAAQRPA